MAKEKPLEDLFHDALKDIYYAERPNFRASVAREALSARTSIVPLRRFNPAIPDVAGGFPQIRHPKTSRACARPNQDHG